MIEPIVLFAFGLICGAAVYMVSVCLNALVQCVRGRDE